MPLGQDNRADSGFARFFFNGREVAAPNGTIVLEAARSLGVSVPALCHHPALRPAGACRLCAVEMEVEPGRAVIQLACLVKVRDNLVVRTDTPLVREARRKALAGLLEMAPGAPRLLALAAEFGIEMPPQPDDCLRCRLCVRVCRDVVGQQALKMEKRGERTFVAPREGACIGCGTCANLCPTGAIRVRDEEGVRTITIRDEVIGRHDLVRCSVCGRLFATERFMESVDVRRSTQHPDIKDHHCHCPTCAKLASHRVTAAQLR